TSTPRSSGGSFRPPPSSGSTWTPPSSSGGSYRPPPSSGSTWTPPSSSSTYTPSSSSTYTPSAPKGSTSPFGGFKFPGLGGGPGGGGIWGAEPTGPGFTANWTESTRTLVAAGAGALILLALGLLVFGLLQGGTTKTPVAVAKASGIT